jgi:peptidoglycan/xylan/chitin deacetylase (PgdA/CDA1 family)
MMLKSTIERVIVGSGAAAVAARRRKGSTLILAYHDIVPDGATVAGDRSLHLPQAAFGRQLDAIRETCDVIALADIRRPSPGGTRPRVVITFDDAYRGAVTAGVEELAARGLPATIFVSPAFIGGRTFWWDAVTALDPASRDHALAACRGVDAAVRAWAADAGQTLRDGAPWAVAATEAELGRAAATDGMTLGSHTWSHPNLQALSVEEVRDELRRPLEWLRSHPGTVLPWLSYPYGLVSAVAEDEARAAGYEGTLRIAGGWVAPGGRSAFDLPRLNIPAGVSQDGFRLRLAGLIGA